MPCTPDSPTYKCLGIGVFEGVPSVGAWCVDKCRKNACVESVCKCSCSPPAPGNDYSPGGGGGILNFFSYVGSGPASTLHPPKVSGISSIPKRYLKF